MMWQSRANSNVKATPTDMGNKESQGSTWIKPSACKSCGEIGHTSKECHDEWPHGAARHQTKGCFTRQISCFLCVATNHIPKQCQLYPIVEQVRQQVQEKDASYSHEDLGDKGIRDETPEDPPLTTPEKKKIIYQCKTRNEDN